MKLLHQPWPLFAGGAVLPLALAVAYGLAPKHYLPGRHWEYSSASLLFAWLSLPFAFSYLGLCNLRAADPERELFPSPAVPLRLAFGATALGFWVGTLLPEFRAHAGLLLAAAAFYAGGRNVGTMRWAPGRWAGVFASSATFAVAIWLAGGAAGYYASGIGERLERCAAVRAAEQERILRDQPRGEDLEQGLEACSDPRILLGWKSRDDFAPPSSGWDPVQLAGMVEID